MLRRAALLLTIASLAFVVGSAAPAFASGGSGSGGAGGSASPPCGSFNMVVGGLAIGLMPQPVTVLVKGKITNCSTAPEGMSLRIDDVTSPADSCQMTSFGWAPGTMSSYGLMSSSNYKAQNIFVARPDCLGRVRTLQATLSLDGTSTVLATSTVTWDPWNSPSAFAV